ncbi:MAG TPA: NAD-dependent epimerase/dehydratase family protein, partial [Pyrinomonadaceae bacterium]|nr:NAD-dependent epimerase/dehydratase family protein [Pyrinomonadaceae bacterium]
MNIVIAGGSGQLGTILARALQADGHQATVLSRQTVSMPWRVVYWDARTLGNWTDELENADVVINLAG